MTPIVDTLTVTPGVTTYDLEITVPNGSRLFLLEAFDNNVTLCYRGRATTVLTGGTASVTIQMSADVISPSVLSVSPVSGATGVAVSSAVTVTFTEAMDASTLTGTTFTVAAGGTAVPGTVGCSGATATFTPTGNLSASTSYSATVTTGAEDLAGNAIASAYTWSFTTGTATATVSAPTFSPAPGSYASAQSVTLSTSTPGASIRYTTDGSTPTSTTGTVYTVPIAVSATTTINAIAYLTGWADSAVTSGTYTIAVTFAQADLAGTWDYVFFVIGRYAGWERGTATIDGSGNVTVNSTLDSTGDNTVPTGPIIETISSTGLVSESGSGGTPSFHGQMSSNKQLVFGTAPRITDNTVTLRVFRKRTGTAFTTTDLANKTFTFHGLRSGTDNNWNYGAGTTDASGAATLTSEVGPAGPLTPGTGGTLSVSPEGIVTVSDDNTWYGLMTDDKNVIFKIDGSVSDGSYGFHVIMVTGQTYTQSDYAGIYNWSVIRNRVPNPSWAYGVSSVDAAGTGTYLSYTDSGGGATPANYTRVLSASGVVTDPADATAHGQMSYNKDITARTNTNAGWYGIVIGFKQ
jgi:hypothetical protein